MYPQFIMTDEVLQWHAQGRYGAAGLSCYVWEDGGLRWYGGIFSNNAHTSRKRPGMLYRINIIVKRHGN